MDKPAPQPLPLSPSAESARQLELWLALRDQLKELNAKLEYVQLMLRVQKGR